MCKGSSLAAGYKQNGGDTIVRGPERGTDLRRNLERQKQNEGRTEGEKLMRSVVGEGKKATEGEM